MPKVTRHPWDRWFRKKRFVLKRNKDYRCMTHSMAQQVRNAAAIRGIKVSIKIDGMRSLEVRRVG